MFPVPSVRTVFDTWEIVRAHNVRLFGLLLYTKQHDVVYSYVHEKDGLFALDAMLRNGYNSKCGIFAFEPATHRWRLWAEQANHLWCQVYCQPDSCPWHGASPVEPISWQHQDSIAPALVSSALTTLADIVSVFTGSGERLTLRDLFEPPFFGENDAFKVTRSFGLKDEEVPCLILFTELAPEQTAEHKGYFRLREVGHEQVADHFQTLISSEDFSEAARQAGC
ncbi:MAG TPA: hypothetical protein VFS83_19665 [Ktedonobacterales bacterium]|nr:hypothetical protein [Ktedonobacterales bacterium]